MDFFQNIIKTTVSKVENFSKPSANNTETDDLVINKQNDCENNSNNDLLKQSLGNV